MLMHLPWAHTINNILNYIFNYEKIINYFNKKYPDKILNINLFKSHILSIKNIQKKFLNFAI